MQICRVGNFQKIFKRNSSGSRRWSETGFFYSGTKAGSAMPLRVPYYEKGKRWTLDRINFGDSQWRKDNLVFNIAIGYPF